MPLTDKQKEYINQNFLQSDDQLSKFLGVSESEIREYTKTISEVLSSLKEYSKTKLSNDTTIIFDLKSATDVLCVLTLPKFNTVSEQNKCLDGIKNFIAAADAGQIGEILLESLKRSANIDDNYTEAYQCINKWLNSRKEDRDIISPLNVFNSSNFNNPLAS